MRTPGAAGPTRAPHEARPLYGEMAWAYDAIVPDRSEEQAHWIASVLPPSCDVLDAGCGTGRLLAALADLGMTVVGVDLSLSALHRARQRDGAAPAVAAGDLRSIPLIDSAVGGVVCRGVLNDVLDDAGRNVTLAEFARVLRPAGRIVIDVRDWARTLERYSTGTTSRRTARTDRGDVVFETTTELDHPSQQIIIDETARTATEQWNNRFAMRCWSTEKLRDRLQHAGLDILHLSYGDDVTWPQDRLVVVAAKTTGTRPDEAEPIAGRHASR